MSAPSTGGRRTTLSLACVALLDAAFPMTHHSPQFDPIDREGLEAPLASTNKDGVYQCKKHTSTSASYLLILVRS